MLLVVRLASVTLLVGLAIPAAASGTRIVGQYKGIDSDKTRPKKAVLAPYCISVVDAAETKTLASTVSI